MALNLPTRVSRLYPLLAIVLLLSSSIFLYAWQSTQIELASLSQKYDQQQQRLTEEVSTLTKDHDANAAQLLVQSKEIEASQTKLTDLEKQVADQTAALTDSQKKLATAQSQLTQQKNQLDTNATELQNLRSRPPLFSFANTSSDAAVVGEEADVKDLVTNAYPYIQNLYGQPYLLNQISLNFVDQFSIAASTGEIEITNGSKGITVTIKLKSFDKNNYEDVNTVIHEMIHAFHGVAVVETSAIEEGMTVAATEAVMDRMSADGKIPNFTLHYLNTNDATYAQYNKVLTVASDNTAFYNSPTVSAAYQLIGTAWYKLYLSDGDIFKQVNEAYYPTVQHGGDATTALIINSVKNSLSTIGDEPISQFLSENKAFNPS